MKKWAGENWSEHPLTGRWLPGTPREEVEGCSGSMRLAIVDSEATVGGCNAGRVCDLIGLEEGDGGGTSILVLFEGELEPGLGGRAGEGRSSCPLYTSCC